MITITLTPQQDTRTPERACYYTATCEIDGKPYQARKRLGAGNELARMLVSAGIPDQPVQVRQAGQPGHTTWHSLYRMALYDYAEGSGTTLRMIRWTPPPDFHTAMQGKAPNKPEGEKPVAEAAETPPPP